MVSVGVWGSFGVVGGKGVSGIHLRGGGSFGLMWMVGRVCFLRERDRERGTDREKEKEREGKRAKGRQKEEGERE